MEDFYCKIFVDSPIVIEELADEVSLMIHVEHDKFLSMEGEYFTIDIMKNKEFNKEKATEFPDGFLYFPYFIDCDVTNDKKINEYKKMIGALLLKLWDSKYRAVASCEFEHELPNNGGYNQTINY